VGVISLLSSGGEDLFLAISLVGLVNAQFSGPKMARLGRLLDWRNSRFFPNVSLPGRDLFSLGLLILRTRITTGGRFKCLNHISNKDENNNISVLKVIQISGKKEPTKFKF